MTEKKRVFFFSISFFINAIESVSSISGYKKRSKSDQWGCICLNSPAMDHLCCSIDMEPKTLNEGEMNHAREVAVDMVQKAEAEEASDIFTKGMKPVVSIEGIEKEVERRNHLHNLVELKECAEIIKRSLDCPCTSTAVEESPDKINIKEPLSAPF